MRLTSKGGKAWTTRSFSLSFQYSCRLWQCFSKRAPEKTSW